MNLQDLTPELIDGPACDALVAEARGASTAPDMHNWDSCDYGGDDGCSTCFRCGNQVDGAEENRKSEACIPDYSTSWDVAMGAAEKVFADEIFFLRRRENNVAWEHRYSVGAMSPTLHHPNFTLSAPTGPLAICRAILKASIQEKA